MKPLLAEAFRVFLMKGLEELLGHAGFGRVAGVDEVGRGSLAGPVVAAAVIVDPEITVPGVEDSKRLAARQREDLSSVIRRTSIAWAVESVSASEIDQGNILQATRTAMRRALLKLQPRPDCAVVDAVSLEDLSFPILPVVRGDSLSYAVACASILAKVERDRRMVDYDRVYPHYDFIHNKGYGAARHRRALAAYGPSPIHRLTFRSVLPRAEERISEGR